MSNTHSKRAVVVFGKVPRPGRVKTRLTPTLSAKTASSIYQAFLFDVFDIVNCAAQASEVTIDRYFVCAMSEDDTVEDAQRLLPRGWSLLDERGLDLGDRINAACEDIEAETVVVLGSDSPTMPQRRIFEAFSAIENEDVWAKKPFVLGPTKDGGYYLVAMSQVRPAIFSNVIWSTTEVLDKTRQNSLQAGIPLVELGEGYDIDYVTDFEQALADAEQGEAYRTAKAIKSVLSELNQGKP
ncbi:MAG: rSAM/selenodomain-associated transferase 1 [Candidatus Endobugula sp.]|jgi:rSAM/selenodomain-associated transferase 1